MNPSKHDWAMYIGEFTRLLENGDISDNDVILLRQKYEMDKLAFVPKTADQNARKLEIRKTIEQATEAIAAELTAPVRAERDALETELAELSTKVELDGRESDRLLKALLRPRWATGAAIKWSSLILIATVSGFPLLATFVPEWMEELGRTTNGDFVIWIIRLVSVAAIVLGGFAKYFETFASWLRKKYLLRALAKLDIQPDKAALLGFSISGH
jgi:hypothetical protein